MKRLSILLTVFMISISAMAQTPAPEVLNNASITSLSKAGLPEAVILSKIQASPCKFEVSTNTLIALKKQGLSDALLKAMIDKTNAPAQAPVAEKKETIGMAGVDLLNHLYAYDKIKGTVKSLEKTTAGMKTTQGMFSATVTLQIDGAASPVRLSSSETIAFVVNTGNNTAPEFVLHKAKSAKGKRDAPGMKASSFSGMKTGEGIISLDVVQLKPGIYQLTPSQALDKGEYFFTYKGNTGNSDAFAFGID